MNQNPKILVVDDETSVTEALKLILEERGAQVTTASSFTEADNLLAKRLFDLVLTDLRLPDGTGSDLLERIKRDTPNTEVILITAQGSIDIAIQIIKQGAFYYLEKPFTPEQVITLAQQALNLERLKIENQALKRSFSSDIEAFGIIGQSAKMRQIYEVIRTAGPSDASVLIEGESGTGKELIATAFHLASRRSTRPIIRINCAAIPHELIESELFGYKKGAFTGADRDKRGLIETADGGTLLLDEIAEMPLHLQTKLLRVLQDRRLRRLGDETEIDIDFRLISSTNQDTEQMIKDEKFRKDLYYRISTIKVKAPPLRERPEDIPILAKRFLERYTKKYNKSIQGIMQTCLAPMMRYDWPGNVRELESAVEHAVLFCQEDQLTACSLPEYLQTVQAAHFLCSIPPFLTMEQIEREAIAQTLERTDGNIKKTAQILSYHRPTLYRKIKKFALIRNGKNSDEHMPEVHQFRRRRGDS
jgi:two-component system response regulator AtoC